MNCSRLAANEAQRITAAQLSCSLVQQRRPSSPLMTKRTRASRVPLLPPLLHWCRPFQGAWLRHEWTDSPRHLPHRLKQGPERGEVVSTQLSHSQNIVYLFASQRIASRVSPDLPRRRESRVPLPEEKLSRAGTATWTSIWPKSPVIQSKCQLRGSERFQTCLLTRRLLTRGGETPHCSDPLIGVI